MSELGTNPSQGGFAIVDAGAPGGAVDLRSDTVDLPLGPTRAIRIGTAGTLHVTLVNGNQVTYPATCLAVGVKHDMQVKRVWVTGTTALQVYGET